MTKRAPRFLLRLPEQVRDHLEAASKAGFRSLTDEILMRLQETMKDESIDEHGVIVRRVSVGLK